MCPIVFPAAAPEPASTRSRTGRCSRASFDGFGGQLDGSPGQYDEPTDSLASRGRARPLLSGERGDYEAAAGDLRAARTRPTAMARATGPGGLLPEQVWDHTARAGQPGMDPGTFSATPLAWTHAQYLRLARDLAAGRIVEQPFVVAASLGLSTGDNPNGLAVLGGFRTG